MPRVPVYDQQVRSSPLPSAAQSSVASPALLGAGGAQLAQAGRAVEQAAEVFDKIQTRDDQDIAFRTEAQLKSEWLDHEAKLREASKGRDAVGYTTKVEQWWAEAGKRYGETLSPTQKKLVNKTLMQSALQAKAGALNYEETQRTASAKAAYESAQAVDVNEATNVGTEAAAIQAMATLAERRKQRAAAEGWTPEMVKVDEIAASSTLHAAMTQKLMRTDPAAAQQYFTKYKGEMDTRTREALDARVTEVSAISDGEKAADAIWSAKGPKQYNEGVDLFTLETDARAAYPNDPTRQKAAVAALRERTNAFNKSQTEMNAQNTNGVYGLLDKGTPITKVMQSTQWLALPEKDRRQITLQLESQAAARESRAAAAESRAFTREQRQDRQLLQGNAGEYLRFTDPNALAKMTRPQVEATRALFGFDGAQHLLNKWDSIQGKEAQLDAKMDKQDFDMVADTMGLNPFKTGMSENEKRALGMLHYRVEQVIQAEQRKLGKPLQREAKMDLMRKEMANTVMVDNTWPFSNENKPVIALTPDDVRNVEIPKADRTRLTALLQKGYTATKNPAYAPTEDNLRMLYLREKSPAGALVQDGKQ